MDKLNGFQKVKSIEIAVSAINDGAVLMCGGFGGVGNPPSLIGGILNNNINNLTLIANDAGFPDIGVGKLVSSRRVKKIITSHIGSNPVAGDLMNQGELEVEFSPQGTLAERIRAGGVGLGGVLTDVGLGTVVEEGKETICVGERVFLIEEALTADVAIVYAEVADTYGNLIYDKTARNFNPLVAMAGRKTIAEVNKIVPLGELNPEHIVTPGIFVDTVVQSGGVNWKWAWEPTKGQ